MYVRSPLIGQVKARLCAVKKASETCPMNFDLWAPEFVGPQIEAMPTVECVQPDEEVLQEVVGESHGICCICTKMGARRAAYPHTHPLSLSHTPRHPHHLMHLSAADGDAGPGGSWYAEKSLFR